MRQKKKNQENVLPEKLKDSGKIEEKNIFKRK